MVFGQGKDEDVSTLIARKNYAKAIEVIKNQLKTQRPDPRLRLQLGDVLVMAGKNKEAAAILTPLADEFAREGFAAKAISVLKKIQKIDPSGRDVNAKLASLIQEKQKQATVPMPSAPSGGMEIGMEEFGFEPFADSVAVPADDQPSLAPEFGLEVEAEAEPEPPPPPPPPAPVVDRDFGGELSGEPEIEPELELAEEPMPPPDAEFSLFDTQAEPEVLEVAPFEAPVVPEPAPFLLEVEPEPLPEVDLFAEAVQAIEVAPEPSVPTVSAPVSFAEPEEEMSESLFADELLSLVEGAFKDSPLEEEAPGAPQDTATGGGNQIVVSPLFKDFSVDELVAVIQGLTLLTYQPGEIILMEGDPGHSLYMLSSGTVRAMRRNPQGRQATVGELAEGAFFGEMSILTGKPRTATVVAATYCELLELDRATLDGIVKTHPRVLDILKEFAAARQKH